MLYESYTIAQNISTETSSTTEKFPGPGRNNRNDKTVTVNYQLNNFSGSIKIQGTLELFPGEDDWSDIDSTSIGGDSSIIDNDYTLNFTGNFLWLRAAYTIQNGTITEIRYNL